MSSAILIHGIAASSRTWWRLAPDLQELGWTVRTPDLAGHGEHHVGAERMTMTQLADDVVELCPGGADLLVGHSLGAVVAAIIASTRAGWTHCVVLEDPPALNGYAVPEQSAAGYLANAEAARRDPDRVRAETAAANPLWSATDVENAVWGRAHLQSALIEASFPGSTWDMPGLVARIAAPVMVLAAPEERSPLDGPERLQVLAAATESRVVDSGHNIHRDRPALWLAEVTRFARVNGV